MKIKVCYVITGLNIGGAEMMLYKLLKYINREKYDPVVISLIKPAGYVKKKIEDLNITVYEIGLKSKFNLLNNIIKFRDIIRKEKPVILHSFMFHADFFARVIGKLEKIPIIISSIRNENIGGKFREILLKYTDFMVDKVTVVSEKVGQVILKKGITKKEKLKVVYNGIEPNRFVDCYDENNVEKLKLELGILKDAKVIINVGRLEPQKNQKLLIESFKELTEFNNNVILLIVGDGYLRTDLEKLCDCLKIKDKVIFAGIRDDIPQLLNMSDIFVLSSSWEGFPNVVIEAMAAGVPVISTDVGGVSEIIGDGLTGFIIAKEKQDDLTKVMKKIIQLDYNKKNSILENASKLVYNKFLIINTKEEIENLYKDLLNNYKDF